MARILIIDDDDEICILVKKVLLLDGHEVDTAEDGSVGLRLARLHKYDLVITDIVMPEQDGLGVIMELKQKSPHIRIIAISGGGGTFNIPEITRIVKMLKVDRAFSKPLDYIELQAAVKELLESA